MSFCTQCGSPLKDGAQFCTSCGHELETKPKPTEASTRTNRKPDKEKTGSFWSRWTKKQKIIVSSITGLVVMLVTAFLLISYFLDQSRTISAFEKAVKEKDANELISLLETTDENLELTEETVKPFITWLSDNPDELREIVADLEEQGEVYDKKGELSASNSDSSEATSIVLLKKEDKFLGIFNRYHLEISPVYLELSAPYAGTVFYVNEEEVGTLEAAEEVLTVGPYLPGPHSVKAVLVEDYIDIESNKDVDLIPGDSSNYLYFDMEAAEVYISTDLGPLNTSAELLVNNEPIEWKLSEDEAFGPVVLDGSINVALKLYFPWGEVTTAEQPIDYNSIFFNVKEEEEIKSIVVDLSEQALSNYLHARANYSTEGLENLTSESSERLLSLVENDENSSEWKTATPLYFDIYPMSYNLYEENGTFYISSVARLTEEVEYIDYVEEESTLFNLDFGYNEQEEKWEIHSIDYSNTYLFDTPEQHPFTYEEVYENTKYQEELNPELISNVENRYYEYLFALTQAINTNDFNLVKDYLKEGSPLYNAQVDLVKNLNEQGVMEEVYDFQITHIEQEGDIVTFEAYEAVYVLHPDDEPVLTENEWIYTGEFIEDRFQLVSIEEK